MTTAAAPTATISKTLKELRDYDGLLYIANNTRNKVTCHEQLGDKRVDFELAPAGEDGSVMIMPRLALEVRGIQRMWLEGKLTVSTDDSFSEQIVLLMTQNTRTPQDRINGIMSAAGDGTSATVDASTATRNLVEKPCLECGQFDPQTGALVRGRVFQTQEQVKDGIPALCDAHKALAPMFVPEHAGTTETGESIWKFNRVSTTAKVTGPRE